MEVAAPCTAFPGYHQQCQGSIFLQGALRIPSCSVPHSSNWQICGSKAKEDLKIKLWNTDFFIFPPFFLLPILTKVPFWTADQLLKLEGQLLIKKTLEQIT